MNFGYSEFVRNVLYPLDLFRSGELSRLRYLKELVESQFFSREEIEQIQLGRLKNIIEHSWRHCPYYRHQMDILDLIPSDINSLEDIKFLPVLTKQMIQENRDEIASQNCDLRKMKSNQTGGSTGEPVSFYVSKDRYATRAAATLRHNSWAGWRIGNKVAAIWGAAQDIPQSSTKLWIRNKVIDRMLLLDAANLSAEVFLAFDQKLKSFRPDHILAYAKSMALFCSYLSSKGITPFQPKSIITSAEVLSDTDRNLIQDTFGCKVFNRYGCREVSLIASECEYHNGMHICAEHLLVEIEDLSSSVEASATSSSILVTDLMNTAMPLIRYRIGDLGAWEENPCPCGRGLRQIKDVSGRITDFVVGDDGRLVSGVFLATYVISKFPELRQVQIRQYDRGRVVFLILGQQKNASLSSLKTLELEAKKHLGERTNIEFQFMENSVLEASGKFLYCKSDVATNHF